MTIATLLLWLPLVVFAVFSARRLMTYLHGFQQQEYMGARFLGWMVSVNAYDRRVSGALLLLTVAVIAAPALPFALYAVPGIVAAVFAVAVLLEPNPLKTGKKKLVLTKRASRILYIALALSIVCAALITYFAPAGWHWRVWPWIVLVQLQPVFLVIGNLTLVPMEKRLQKKYWNEAHAILKRLDPTIIGITGSYGKTSVKHILGHILQTNADTLVTPGSVNTPMGIARIVRERLRPNHRFFVAEMGAYGVGSVARLCRLAPPKHGIFSVIGKAHLERFGSQETIARAKLELADAVNGAGGIMVASSQVRDMVAEFGMLDRLGAAVVCGDAADADYRIEAFSQDRDGLRLTLAAGSESVDFQLPIWGIHHATNAALAIGLAHRMGMTLEDIQLTLRSMPQIAHRLEVKPQAGGWTLIDNAYNSNPSGFEMSLELLDILVEKPGRRILISPGMAELGADHDSEHARLGKIAAERADIFIAVLPQRIPTMVDAFSSAAPQADLMKVPAMRDALNWLDKNVLAGDVVLIENDLPDIYESPPRL